MRKATYINGFILLVLLLLLLGKRRLLSTEPSTKPKLPLPRRDDGVLISPPGIQGEAHDVEENERSHTRRPAIGTHISLDTYAPARVVDPQFLSVAIGAGDMRSNWASIDFTAPRIINMARALNPAMLRVGGTSQDFLTFNASTPERKGPFTASKLLLATPRMIVVKRSSPFRLRT